MKKLILITLLASITLLNLLPFGGSTGQLFAQYQFDLAIGGTGIEVGYSIIQTTDGGYAMAGWTTTFGAGSEDVYVVKLDAGGGLQWTKTIGGGGYDVGMSIVQTTDGGYAIGGTTTSFGAGNRDVYVVKLDGTGTLQWTKTVGGIYDEYGRSIVHTSDGGYAIGGFTDSFGEGGWDAYAVKLDSTGTLQWTKTVGGTNYDQAQSIIQTTDGGYALAGNTQSYGYGSYNMYAVKLDSAGSLQWTKVVGGTVSDQARSIIQTGDGGYAIAGLTNSFGAGGTDVYMVKLDSSGALLWTRTIGGRGDEEGYSIIQTTDGGYAVGGYSGSYGTGIRDFYLLKSNDAGTLQWAKTIGGTNDDYGYSVVQTTDGGYAMTGLTYSFGAGITDVNVMKFDSSGNSCIYPGTVDTTGSGGLDTTGGVESSGGVEGTGGAAGSGGTLDTICNVDVYVGYLTNEQNSVIIYPNPASASFTVQGDFARHAVLQVFDVTGGMVYRQLLSGNRQQVDVRNLSKGLYVWHIGSARGKFVVE